MASYLGTALLDKSAASNPLLQPARKFFLPGMTTHGHYQIELACESCHTSPFGGRDVIQEACVGCHGEDLKLSEDKHPRSKFTDPRNAELLLKIDATQCVTCHTEHRLEITGAMGVTLPQDLCFYCHQDIAEDRPSHAGMAFTTCASAGCHNYHDNRALYEDFLLKHHGKPELADSPRIALRDFREFAAMSPDYPSQAYPMQPLAAADADAPAAHAANSAVMNDWLATSHAEAGVNCSACHMPADQSPAPSGPGPASQDAWIPKPDHQVCASCHSLEVKGFLSGKHGMRLAAELGSMSPRDARLPMRGDSHDRELGCVSCHNAHRFDTRVAAIDACLGCHADEHSLAYKQSPHYEAWIKEMAGDVPPGSGVTCATCHMPRLEHRNHLLDVKRMVVQHNQNDTLRPNEKMIRPACLQCHALGFALDSLADEALIRANFSGRPSVHVQSIEMAVERLRKHEEERRNRASAP